MSPIWQAAIYNNHQLKKALSKLIPLRSLQTMLHAPRADQMTS
jgi:hypothetical protein